MISTISMNSLIFIISLILMDVQRVRCRARGPLEIGLKERFGFLVHSSHQTLDAVPRFLGIVFRVIHRRDLSSSHCRLRLGLHPAAIDESVDQIDLLSMTPTFPAVMESQSQSAVRARA